MPRSYVVTGGGQGIGRAIVERLVSDDAHIVIIERERPAVAWVEKHAARVQMEVVIGDAADERAASDAADLAQAAGTLAGWVNSAAIFRDAMLHSAPPPAVLDLITQNLAPALFGSATAVRRFLSAGTGGAIVNLSSHQAQRAVRGALPYVTAKAALEGLTRALAVDYGRYGIRANAVALGSIATERYKLLLQQQDQAAAASVQASMRRLHPLGRVGDVAEVAAAVAFLLSDAASFITGATIPVDGGRAALGLDPEAHEL